MYKVTSIEKTCQKCGVVFRVKKHRTNAKWCSWVCQGRNRKPGGSPGRCPDNAFQRGRLPWNTGVDTGDVFSANGFKPGHRPRHASEIGAVRLRSDHGKVRAFVKTGEPSKWALRAVLAWESVNGPLLSGRVVHHKDRNPLNDDPSNLEALTPTEHTNEHRGDINAGLTLKAMKRRATLDHRGTPIGGAKGRSEALAWGDDYAAPAARKGGA